MEPAGPDVPGLRVEAEANRGALAGAAQEGCGESAATFDPELGRGGRAGETSGMRGDAAVGGMTAGAAATEHVTRPSAEAGGGLLLVPQRGPLFPRRAVG